MPVPQVSVPLTGVWFTEPGAVWWRRIIWGAVARIVGGQLGISYWAVIASGRASVEPQDSLEWTSVFSVQFIKGTLTTTYLGSPGVDSDNVSASSATEVGEILVRPPGRSLVRGARWRRPLEETAVPVGAVTLLALLEVVPDFGVARELVCPDEIGSPVTYWQVSTVTS